MTTEQVDGVQVDGVAVRHRDRTKGGQIEMLSAWIPAAWSAPIDDEVTRLAEIEDRKVSRSDVVRAALVAYFDDSEIRRETHFVHARNGDPLR